MDEFMEDEFIIGIAARDGVKEEAYATEALNVCHAALCELSLNEPEMSPLRRWHLAESIALRYLRDQEDRHPNG